MFLTLWIVIEPWPNCWVEKMLRRRYVTDCKLKLRLTGLPLNLEWPYCRYVFAFKKVKNLGFSADRLIRHYFPFKGLFRHSPLSMRIHTHHWSIRNCISTIPDTTMIAKVIMSSPSILVDFFEDNSWSRWGSNPGPLAWEADMLTTTPPGLRFYLLELKPYDFSRYIYLLIYRDLIYVL